MKSDRKIVGVVDLVRSGALVMSELLRVIQVEGGQVKARLDASLEASEVPILTIRVLDDGSGVAVELVTQQEGDVRFTRHAILPILKVIPGSAIN